MGDSDQRENCYCLRHKVDDAIVTGVISGQTVCSGEKCF